MIDKLVIGMLPAVPRPIMRRFSARYIAGERLEEALDKLAEFQQRGYPGILDVLGEDVADEAEARAALSEYKRAAVAQAERGLDSHVSVKPTHFGLRISADLAGELYAELLEHCRELGQFARIEMEDRTTTDATLTLFDGMRSRFDAVGIVLQARLLRTPDDIDALGEGPVNVRLVKGVYLEPAEIAHSAPQQIRDAFVECTERLFQRGHTVAFATHDEHLVARLLRAVKDRGISSERYSIEVLMGVQEKLWSRWKAAGVKVRVYVPYGSQWRSYSQRRLRKNPEILRHVLRNLIGG